MRIYVPTFMHVRTICKTQRTWYAQQSCTSTHLFRYNMYVFDVIYIYTYIYMRMYKYAQQLGTPTRLCRYSMYVYAQQPPVVCDVRRSRRLASDGATN